MIAGRWFLNRFNQRHKEAGPASLKEMPEQNSHAANTDAITGASRMGAWGIKSWLEGLSDWLNWERDPNGEKQRMLGRGSPDNKSRDKKAASTKKFVGR